MSYTNDDGQVISIDDMSYEQEREFREHFRAFGRDDAADNRGLGLSFDGMRPGLERIDQNIDKTHAFDGADEATIEVARDEYATGWEDWCESLDEDEAKELGIAIGVE
jgi:hypothetical protein